MWLGEVWSLVTCTLLSKRIFLKAKLWRPCKLHAVRPGVSGSRAEMSQARQASQAVRISHVFALIELVYYQKMNGREMAGQASLLVTVSNFAPHAACQNFPRITRPRQRNSRPVATSSCNTIRPTTSVASLSYFPSRHMQLHWYQMGYRRLSARQARLQRLDQSPGTTLRSERPLHEQVLRQRM